MVSPPLKILVSWDDYPQYMEKTKMSETTNQFKFQVKLEGSQCTFQTCKIHSYVFNIIQSITELDDWMNMIKQRKLNMCRIFHLFNGKYICSACAARAKNRFHQIPVGHRGFGGFFLGSADLEPSCCGNKNHSQVYPLVN